MKPVPGVVIVAPRVFWNTVNGVGPGEGVVAPPPSQLISRRPDAERPGVVGVVRIAERGAERVDRRLEVARDVGSPRRGDRYGVQCTGQQQAAQQCQQPGKMQNRVPNHRGPS